MFDWLKSLFKAPTPVGPPSQIRAFGPADRPIAQTDIAADAATGGWLITARSAQSFRLFEVPLQKAEQCMLTYRAQMKTQDLAGKAYLELWCRVPGRGEFFSKGIANAASGSSSWASYEVPFFLRKAQVADMVRLNLAVEGQGTIWVKDIQLLSTALR